MLDPALTTCDPREQAAMKTGGMGYLLPAALTSSPSSSEELTQSSTSMTVLLCSVKHRSVTKHSKCSQPDIPGLSACILPLTTANVVLMSDFRARSCDMVNSPGELFTNLSDARTALRIPRPAGEVSIMRKEGEREVVVVRGKENTAHRNERCLMVVARPCCTLTPRGSGHSVYLHSVPIEGRDSVDLRSVSIDGEEPIAEATAPGTLDGVRLE